MEDQIDLSSLGLDGKVQFADHIRASIAAMHRTYLTVLAALDSEDNWRPDGSTSMGRWVAARHAVTAGGGEELVRVAHRLEELPAIGAAYGAGEPLVGSDPVPGPLRHPRNRRGAGLAGRADVGQRVGARSPPP